MIKYGRLVVCENCGRVAFEEMNLGGRIGEHIYAIKEEGWRYGDQHDDNVTLCPCCHALFKNSKFCENLNFEIY